MKMLFLMLVLGLNMITTSYAGETGPRLCFKVARPLFERISETPQLYAVNLCRQAVNLEPITCFERTRTHKDFNGFSQIDESVSFCSGATDAEVRFSCYDGARSSHGLSKKKARHLCRRASNTFDPLQCLNEIAASDTFNVMKEANALDLCSSEE